MLAETVVVKWEISARKNLLASTQKSVIGPISPDMYKTISVGNQVLISY